jgi:hypothetical protein
LKKIKFLKNNGDTENYNLEVSDSLWNIVIDNSNPNCINKRQDWYQILHKKYTNQSSGNSIEIYHSYKKEIDRATKFGGPFESTFSIEFFFNNQHHSFYEGVMVNPHSSKQYYGELQINNKVYSNVVYTYDDTADSLSGKAFFNKEYGLLKFEDRKNNISWTMIN